MLLKVVLVTCTSLLCSTYSSLEHSLADLLSYSDPLKVQCACTYVRTSMCVCAAYYMFSCCVHESWCQVRVCVRICCNLLQICRFLVLLILKLGNILFVACFFSLQSFALAKGWRDRATQLLTKVRVMRL